MTYKPELLTTAGSIEELKRLMDAGANAFVIGEARYGMRLGGDFDPAAIAEAVKLASPRGVNIYVSLNNLMDNSVLDSLPGYVRSLSEAGVNGIVFGDPAVLMAVRAEAPHIPLHWNAEMTSTNYRTAEYWGKRGATRFVLARELNMDQIIEMKSATKLQLEVQVHGITNIYHSKRSLVNSYLDHQQDTGRLDQLDQHRGLYLTEDERPGERYPIYEDANGTHIMSSDDLCMLENVHELLEVGVDSLKIEGVMKSIEYNEAVVRAYRQAIDAYMADPEAYAFQEEWLDDIKAVQDPNRELSYGFFYKEQVY
ncbi:peptidase U32 family protein [Paenibacillus radicis (ex Gao et al. 2016)]|uniref:Protease YrrN n=1 Tax=Paenibacillus radicis (ex Gao et al. 2016) TaxID=1737354 RepID=A0A917HM64_9BACL|nr:peptidase U32 family protein [Paenibacillus radicis (ex Gao et al. 2016)]GGG83928.1 putative protease YrrN [Paenibacillus radicis (ex Gao et al. 2016)]